MPTPPDSTDRAAARPVGLAQGLFTAVAALVLLRLF